MRVEHIEISSFRNLRGVSYEPEGLWVVFGPNGSGKSNLLEAISSLASRQHLGSRGRDSPQGFARFVVDGTRLSSNSDILRMIQLIFSGPGEVMSAIQAAQSRALKEDAPFPVAVGEELWGEIKSRLIDWARMTEDLDAGIPDLSERFIDVVVGALNRPRVIWNGARTWLGACEADLPLDAAASLNRLRQDLDERISEIDDRVENQSERYEDLDPEFWQLDELQSLLSGPYPLTVDLPHGDHWTTGVEVVEYDADPDRVESDVDAELALLHNSLWDAKPWTLGARSVVSEIPAEASPYQRVDPWLHEEADGAAQIRGSVQAVYGQISRMANLVAPDFVLAQGRVIVRPRRVAEWPVVPARTWIGIEAANPDAADGLLTWDELHLSLLGSGTRRWVGASVREACRRLRGAKMIPQSVAEERDSDQSAEPSEIVRAAAAAGTFDGYFEVLAEPAAAVVIVDEPEAHLHPLAQREIAKWLVDLSRQHAAVVVATHSPAFLSIAPEHATLSALVPSESESILVSLDADLLGATRDLATALGLDLQDILLLARGFLLVEGIHDKRVLDHFFRDEFDQARIVILPIFGTDNSRAVIESPVLRVLGRPIRAMFDHLRPEYLDGERDISGATKEEQTALRLKHEFADCDFDVIPYSDPDIICALPEEAVRRAYPDAVFPGWNALIDKWTRSPSPVNFKGHALKEMGLFTTKSTAFIERVLTSCSEHDRAGQALTIAVNEALASMS